MNDNLPFKYCNDDELNDILSVEINKVKTNTDTKITSSILAQNLPFHKCSDFVMLTECVTNKDRFLEFFENNAFLSEYHSIIEGLSTDNYTCRYYSEDKFNSMVPKQQDNSLKIYHLNIRSLNKNCHQLKAFLSCLNCNFDVILLTEIGITDKPLIERVFDNYIHYTMITQKPKREVQVY